MKWHRLTSVGLLICSAPTSAQELPTQNLLPLALAQEAAFAGVSSCAANGFRKSVAVVDADGIARVTMRGDGAGAHTLNGAFRKAYTAAAVDRTRRGEPIESPFFGIMRCLVLTAHGDVAIPRRLRLLRTGKNRRNSAGA
jgi:hypothetical protein